MRTKLILFLLVVVSLCSCKKNDDIEQPLGYYSFKLSGVLELEQASPMIFGPDGTPLPSEGFVPKRHVFSMTPESGQMTILEQPGSNQCVVTLNTLAAGATVGVAEVTGRNIDISFPGKAMQFNNAALPDEQYRLQGLLPLVGKGERIDEMLVIQLQTSGFVLYMNEYYTVKNSSFECVARINH